MNNINFTNTLYSEDEEVEYKLYPHSKISRKDIDLLNNQENKCYICNTDLLRNKDDIFKTPCNHFYHYECMYYTTCQDVTNPHKKKHNYDSRECPYCRNIAGLLLKQVKKKVINVHVL